MDDYKNIFNSYTAGDINFYLLAKNITFPDDKSLIIYGTKLIQEDTPWTVLSYNFYGKIDYWWLLASLNRKFSDCSSIFYAPQGKVCYYVKKDYLQELLN